MPTVLQAVLRAFTIVILSAFWSAFTAFNLFIEWWKHKDSTGRSFFTARNHQTPPKCLTEGPWTHGFLQLTNIRMHYVEAGDKKNPLMVLVHGFPEFWYSYRFQLKYFRHKYRVVALDMRGYNDTDKPVGIRNYDAGSLAGDVAEAIEQLGGKAILVGHDLGGMVCWILALLRPELIADRMIILNVPHHEAFQKRIQTTSSQFLKSWYMFMFQCPLLPEISFSANDFAYLENVFRKQPMGLVHQENFTDEDLEAWKHVFSKPNAVTPPLNYYRALGMGAVGRRQQNASAEPVKVKPKTLIIWGEKDTALDVEGAELSITLCRDARLVRIPDASHWVQQDVPDRVNALIEEFIQ
ncbi:alpha/beta hydrolase fold domain-containing protein [Ditylenchus destructor]|uniref:Alpha/beta hydrolase fold domain-containing protein n=1 Tax=Ditylenchus destructor TaxID=166010 RepID=A0AAD4MX81_9BILA|nr:alpha/beta hydrolase fold domain-containing protein [Ditylenchus destructor]